MNKHHKNLKVLTFVGLSGSGKSSATDHLTSKGYPKVYFGGVILGAMKDLGIEFTPENEKKFREEYRQKYGKDAVANKIIEQIKDLNNSGNHRIIADGLYSWTEYKLLKQEFGHNLIVVALFTPPHLRYRRLSGRPLRPMSENETKMRDYSEIENLEKGGPVAIADHVIINDNDMDKFYEQIDELLEKIEF